MHIFAYFYIVHQEPASNYSSVELSPRRQHDAEQSSEAVERELRDHLYISSRYSRNRLTSQAETRHQ